MTPSRILCSLLLVSLASIVSATITVGEKHYTSLPAVFGMPWKIMENYEAHLQILESNPFLCQHPNLLPPTNERQMLHRTNQDNQIVVPSDGIPVVLLVSRGACSFEEKARMAMSYDFVQYIIVYDDRTRSALIPMSATDPNGISIGLLFVSHGTGMQLLEIIRGQSANTTAAGGMVISMDARSPIMPPSYDETQEWMLAAMAGFFTFLACFGCLLVCIQAGYIPADGRIVIHATPRERRRLLTEAQVYTLPQVLATEEDSGCAICIEEYQEGETLRVLPCDHKFHTDCLLPWLTQRHASCPLCKHDISVVDTDRRSSHRWWSTIWSSQHSPVSTDDEDVEDEVEAPPDNGSENSLSSDATTPDAEALLPSEST